MKNVYRFSHFISSIFLMLILLWATISLPLVAEAKQKWKQTITQKAQPAEESNSPLQTNSEERAGSTINILEEFFHQQQEDTHQSFLVNNRYVYFSDVEYLAFHGELFSPPPNC